MSEIPTLFKSVSLYFNYTEKLRSNNAVIAYACLTYAVEKSFALVKANPQQKEAKKFLISKLDELEKIKGDLGVSSKGEAKTKIQEFCVQLFVKINKSQMIDDDITKKHAIEFNRASHFIQTLSAFDALSEEWKQKLKYCQVKAAQISKDLREGKKPKRGNPFDPQNDSQQIEQNKNVGFNDPDDEGEADPMQTAKDPEQPPQINQKYTPPPQQLPVAKIPQTFSHPLAQSTVSVGKVSHGSITPRTKIKAKHQAKKLAENGVQQLQFDNLKQALLQFEKAVTILKSVC